MPADEKAGGFETRAYKSLSISGVGPWWTAFGLILFGCGQVTTMTSSPLLRSSDGNRLLQRSGRCVVGLSASSRSAWPGASVWDNLAQDKFPVIVGGFGNGDRATEQHSADRAKRREAEASPARPKPILPPSGIHPTAAATPAQCRTTASTSPPPPSATRPSPRPVHLCTSNQLEIDRTTPNTSQSPRRALH